MTKLSGVTKLTRLKIDKTDQGDQTNIPNKIASFDESACYDHQCKRC